MCFLCYKWVNFYDLMFVRRRHRTILITVWHFSHTDCGPNTTLSVSLYVCVCTVCDPSEYINLPLLAYWIIYNILLNFFNCRTLFFSATKNFGIDLGYPHPLLFLSPSSISSFLPLLNSVLQVAFYKIYRLLARILKQFSFMLHLIEATH